MIECNKKYLPVIEKDRFLSVISATKIASMFHTRSFMRTIGLISSAGLVGTVWVDTPNIGDKPLFAFMGSD